MFSRIKIYLAIKIESWKVQCNATFPNYHNALTQKIKIGVNRKNENDVLKQNLYFFIFKTQFFNTQIIYESDLFLGNFL